MHMMLGVLEERSSPKCLKVFFYDFLITCYNNIYSDVTRNTNDFLSVYL